MARISIREYEHIMHVANGTVPVGREPAVASQTFALGGASAQSAVFQARTRFVRIAVDLAATLDFGVNPTAVDGACDMPAGCVEYFGIGESGLKVAFKAT